MLRIIEHASRERNDHDYSLLAIISEETQPFFEGDKSAAEVAKILQSRVSLYLPE